MKITATHDKDANETTFFIDGRVFAKAPYHLSDFIEDDLREAATSGSLTYGQIEEFARHNYNEGYGWEVIVECWDEEDAEEYTSVPFAEGLKALLDTVYIVTSHHDDIAGEAF